MVTRKYAVKLIRQSKGKFFSCIFTKRTTGEERHMVARTGVTAYLRGGPPTYDPKKKRLIICFDLRKMGYRAIPIEGINWVKVNGVWRKVT